MSTPPCPVCGCRDAANATAHAITAALAQDDLDSAIETGLLTSSGCAACSDACRTALFAARDDRLRALAARERFRAREARLQRRADERAVARAGVTSAVTIDTATPKPSLPSAAAAALARAKAKAAERKP